MNKSFTDEERNYEYKYQFNKREWHGMEQMEIDIYQVNSISSVTTRHAEMKIIHIRIIIYCFDNKKTSLNELNRQKWQRFISKDIYIKIYRYFPKFPLSETRPTLKCKIYEKIVRLEYLSIKKRGGWGVLRGKKHVVYVIKKKLLRFSY